MKGRTVSTNTTGNLTESRSHFPHSAFLARQRKPHLLFVIKVITQQILSDKRQDVDFYETINRISVYTYTENSLTPGYKKIIRMPFATSSKSY